MVVDLSSPVSTFLDAAAARQATPGGGAVAALSGALACSMLEMVINYSIGKKSLEAHQDKLREVLSRATATRRKLETLVTADQAAYLELTAAKKLPPDAAGRGERVAVALAEAVQVPTDILVSAGEILEMSAEVVEMSNPWLLSDLAVAADLALAATRSGAHNIRINLSEVGNAATRGKIQAAMDTIVSIATASHAKLAPRIWERIRENNPG